ncbi:MAG: hypothetical protein ABIG92_02095 [Candidatus Omnitrophota bacterium]
MDSYKFLGIAAIIFKVLAFVAVAFGVISSIVIFVGGGSPDAPRVTGFIGLLLGAIYFFICFTVSEVISLLLKMAKKLDKCSSV